MQPSGGSGRQSNRRKPPLPQERRCIRVQIPVSGSAAAAIVAAASVVIAAAAVVAAAHAEQQNQNDDPPHVVAIVTAHNQFSFSYECRHGIASGSRCCEGKRRFPLPSLMICTCGKCVTAVSG